MPANKKKKYFTTGDVARYCEVDVNTVKSWIHKASLEAFTTPSGHYRIARRGFISFIKEQGFVYDPAYFGDNADLEAPDILVIDGDSDLGDLIVHFLRQSYNNLRIGHVHNGFDGYVVLRRSEPRLIVINLHKPGIAGLEFLRILRLNDELKDTKVLAVLPDRDDTAIRKVEELKVDELILRPLTRKALKEKCDRLMGEPSAKA